MEGGVSNMHRAKNETIEEERKLFNLFLNQMGIAKRNKV